MTPNSGCEHDGVAIVENAASARAALAWLAHPTDHHGRGELAARSAMAGRNLRQFSSTDHLADVPAKPGGGLPDSCNAAPRPGIPMQQRCP